MVKTTSASTNLKKKSKVSYDGEDLIEEGDGDIKKPHQSYQITQEENLEDIIRMLTNIPSED